MGPGGGSLFAVKDEYYEDSRNGVVLEMVAMLYKEVLGGFAFGGILITLTQFREVLGICVSKDDSKDLAR